MRHRHYPFNQENPNIVLLFRLFLHNRGIWRLAVFALGNFPVLQSFPPGTDGEFLLFRLPHERVSHPPAWAIKDQQVAVVD